ncbi:hypothetical protein NDU88_000085, partial [Pleurodeles waltl]
VHPRSSQDTVPLYGHTGASRVFTGHSTTPEVTVPLHRHTPGLHRSQYHSSGMQVHP